MPRTTQAFLARGIGMVEDHPLFHFYPGIKTLGVGAMGCSAACRYCQNWELALAHRESNQPIGTPVFRESAEIVELARARGCGGIALTYNEPTVWIEALCDLLPLARKAGLHTILVTNGYVTEETMMPLLPYLDAVKIDLKGHDDAFYRRTIGIELAPVLQTLQLLSGNSIWVELSTVIIPGANDSKDAVQQMSDLILRHAGADIPWHLMRFFPAYQMVNHAVGDLTNLLRLRQQARDCGLRYVYISNVPGVAERHTWCPSCDELLASRSPVSGNPLKNCCQNCGQPISGRGLVVCQG